MQVRPRGLALVILLFGEAMPHLGWCDSAKAEFALRYQSEPGCPSEAAFMQEIAARTSRAVRTDVTAASPRFDIALRMDAEAAAGSLTIHQGDGSSSIRSVRAPTCVEVAAALALVVALTLDPNATTSRTPGATPLPQVPDLPAPDHAPPRRNKPVTQREADLARTPPATRRTNNKDNVTPPKPVTAPARTKEPPEPIAEPPPEHEAVRANVFQNPERTPSEGVAPDKRSITSQPQSDKDTHRRWTPSAGAALALQRSLAPWWMVGAAVQVSGSHVSGWAGRAGVAIFPLSRGTAEQATAAFGLWSLRGEGCYEAPRAHPLHLFGCGALEVGRVTAAGEAGGPILTGVTGSATWLAVVAIAGIAVPIGPLTINGQAEAIAPLIRDQFGIRTGPEFASVHQPARLGLGARIGLSYPFFK